MWLGAIKTFHSKMAKVVKVPVQSVILRADYMKETRELQLLV